MGKTIIEWFETAPHEWRGKAIENLKSYKAEIVKHSLSDALLSAFVWSESPQGVEYWAEIAEQIRYKI